ncbi:MAG: response regulator [Deltaproteobacteria bacterium]|jgi:two-component system cell cycle sensor histidine kinase/response regulator CckA|nr:response regulator [Deltaproteobacteria bacterium]
MSIESKESRGTILLVDDEPEILELLQRQLEARNFKIFTARSGDEALGQLPGNNIDIMITDVRMPGMDGITLLERALLVQSNLQALIITGHGELDTALRAMRLGAYNFLLKPVGLPELEISLKNCLKKVHLRKKVARQQEALQQAHDDLEIRVAARTRELTQLVQDLQEKDDQLRHAHKMKALGSLAGGIAHDFNNLLMGIQGHISLLISQCGPVDPQFSHLLNIETLVESGGRLTRQLLGYARQGQYDVRLLNFNKLLHAIIETFSRTRPEISIQTQMSPEPQIIHADQGQIEQVLFNLFINAADAMPRGGTLTITSHHVPAQTIAAKVLEKIAGDYIHLTVTDSGTGIPDHIKPHIFEPFFTTKEQSRGTGLGLASTYGIVAAYSGHIEVESKIDEGTTFHIYLPASTESLASTGRASAFSKRPAAGTILLVDDDESIRETGQVLLEARGFQVFTAHDGHHALEVYQKKGEEIDLVVLDMIMPRMGGSETFDRLQEINPAIKVLLSTGYSIEGQAADIVGRGCAGYIQKPFNMADLTKKIMEII